MFFWNSLAFSMIQRMLAVWSLVPLPFLHKNRSHKQKKGTAYRLGENDCKGCDQQRLNFQNIQIAHVTP